MSKQDIERTLGHVLPDHAMVPATLNGYRRDWSAVRLNADSSWKWLIDRQTGMPPRFIAYLNITADNSSSVEGMLFPVEEGDIEKLDRREVGYDRIKVSVSDMSGNNIDARVFTYADRSREHVSGEVYISYHYLNFVRTKCLELEHVRKAYFEHTSLPDARLADLDVVYFNRDFSELYKLELDEHPAAKKIAIQTGGNWKAHLTDINTTDAHQASWMQRFCLACQSNAAEQIRHMQHDPCFLVRAIIEYRKNKEHDMKLLLHRQLAHAQKHGLMFGDSQKGGEVC